MRNCVLVSASQSPKLHRTIEMDKLLVLFALAALCMAQPLDEPISWQLRPYYQRTALGDSIDKSTFKLLKTAYDLAENKNVVSSPLSLMTLLSLYINGAGEGVQKEVAEFLGEPNARQATDDFKQLSAQFSSMNPDYLTLANKVYVSNKFSLNDGFAAKAREYKSEVENVNFDNTSEAAAIINRWADEKTKGNIKKPINAEDLDGAVTALCNVIFFKGHWSVPFKADRTKDKDFHLSKTEKVKKPMMHLLQSLYYTESAELGAKMIELPYKEKGFRMVVVLPNEIDGLPAVLEKASNKGLLKDVFNLSPSDQKVDLDMPKFEVKSNLDFNAILPQIGVSKLFNEPAEGIVKDVSVQVSKAVQEAFIKVDEEGATAGALTVMVVANSASWPPPVPLKFDADHPFLYVILYEDKILFAGTYTN